MDIVGRFTRLQFYLSIMRLNKTIMFQSVYIRKQYEGLNSIEALSSIECYCVLLFSADVNIICNTERGIELFGGHFFLHAYLHVHCAMCIVYCAIYEDLKLNYLMM